MKEGLSQVVKFAEQVVSWIGTFLEMVWTWSFGQILKMFKIPFESLPLWKQIVFVAVVIALVYFFWSIFTDILEAIQKVLSAGLGLLSAIIEKLQDVLIAGIIALVGAWIITSVNAPMLDSIKLW